jgi:hypothetical protein
MKRALLCIAISAAFITSMARSSLATTTPWHAVSYCKQDLTDSFYNGTLGITSDHQFYDAGSGDNGVQIVCPLAFTQTNVLVAGFAAGSNTISARVCYQPLGGGTPQCNPPTGPMNGGGVVNFPVTVPNTVTRNDFMYIQIRMFDGGGTVWGYSE